MKQELRVIALALAMALVFLCGVVVGTSNGGGAVVSNGTADSGNVSTGSNNSGATDNKQNQSSLADQAGNSGNNGAEDNNGGAEDNNGGATSSATVKTSSGLEMPAADNYAGICEAYNKAVNDYRAYKGVVTTKKVETVDIKAKDIPKVVEGVVNGVVQKFLGTTENQWTFENGADQADPSRLIGHKMIPYDRDAKVTTADLTAAAIKENSDGGYTITITFVSESTSFVKDGASTKPDHHMTAMDPLDLGSLDISPLEISSAEMTYPGATTELTVDSQGRLVKLHNVLPLSGNGSGGYKAIKLSLGLEGKMDSVYEMTYA